MIFYIILLFTVIYSAGLNTSEWSNDTVQSNGNDESQLKIEDFNILSVNNYNNYYFINNTNGNLIRNQNLNNTSDDDNLSLLNTNTDDSIDKIDVLSKLLRVHVDNIRDNTDQVEMIFLVDASSSVGLENFNSELNFVRKLLSDLRVGESETRVAVVTFAGKGMVIRNIDQISSNRVIGNKCRLLNEELGEIKWSGGGTYTRGALLEAQSILHKSHSDAKKVVFLITDGFSNGGDPRPVAKMLKDIGAIILTFGIRTGKIDELHDIASEPGYIHSYLLDSFAEFEAMARRALHRDLTSGQYISSISQQSCDVFCNNTTADNNKYKNTSQCCDNIAECYCDVTSGHYTCMCPIGYFGSGLKGSCHPCVNGTYGSIMSPGDSSANCLPCPSANHIILKIPATSLNDCVCASGFIKNGTNCDAITCPKLRIPENGYLVKTNACSNVVNAACGVRCRIGFRLIGDSIRLCGNNGTWSGTETQCILKTCPTLRPPIHGRVHCEYDDEYDYINSIKRNDSLASALPIDARCQFKCNNGYQLLGSKVRNCLPVSRWDGLKVTCKQIKCDPLAPLANGFISPNICTGMKKLVFGTNCSFSCSLGFELKGPTSRRCMGSSGLWSQRHIVSQCVDNTPPKIKCPDNSIWKTLPGKRYSLVTWSNPIVSDNSDKQPQVWTKPHLILPWKSKIGVHSIIYIAEDLAGNKVRCRFTVTVVDEEPPVIENCLDPPIFLTSLINGADNVTWDEPNFYDNSGKKVVIQKSHAQQSFFPLGTTQVIYNATDKSYNMATCILNITVENVCRNLPAISNSRADCETSVGENMICAITCDEGYIFPLQQNHNDDNIMLKCNSYENNWNEIFIPNCSVTEVPLSVEFGGSIFLESNSTICQNPMTLESLKMYIHDDLSENFNDSCTENGIDCRLSKMDFNCEIIDNMKNNRKRRRWSEKMEIASKNRVKRKRDKIEIKFWFLAEIIANHQHDPHSGIEKLREEIQSMSRSGTLNLLDERTNQEISKLALNLRTIFIDDFKEKCNSGSINRKNKCVKCPPGTFYNSIKNYCTACHLGYYQDKSGSTSCKQCPEHTSTKKIHSISINDCIKLCKPGSYSKRKYHRDQIVSMEPCALCDIGYYQSFYGERQCRPCPGNATTDARGSIVIDNCINTQDSCNPNACLNNGQCIREFGGYSCECTDSYIGSRCEKHRDPCEMWPCLNGGICFVMTNTFDVECKCTSKYTGRHCELYIDECFSNPCKNNGTCISNENDFSCSCLENFTGEFCEIPQDLCVGICNEGSTCLIIDGTWRCLCKPGYLGRRCHLLPCDWLPCHSNAICINIEEINATHESYRCQCPIGFRGDDCLTLVDHCHNSPCKNGGTCVNNLLHYTCECSLLFDGLNCENKLSSDYVMHFVKPGITDYVLFKDLKTNITEFTLCLWLQSMDTFNYGTVFSYATHNQDNAITFTDYNGFVFYINGFNVVTDISLNDGYWHFICVTWKNSDGSWMIYVDGNRKDSGEDLATNTTIEGNGSVVIGQEQDYIQGGFSVSEAFVGQLTLLDIWDTILDEKLIKHLSETCENYHGNLIAWGNLKKHIRGDIKIIESKFCHGCDIPSGPYRGYVNISEDLREAIYSCELGYNLRVRGKVYNSIKRQCLKQGQWNDIYNLKCSKIICGFPGYFPRGRIHGNSFLFGDEIYYTCDEGYQLRGNPHRVCNSDGNWSGRPPICIGITCKSLLAPEHGDIEYIIDEHERDDISILQVGQQLEFKCDLAYELVGEQLLTCMKSGEWNYPIPFCQSIGCPPPTPLDYGYIKYNKNNTVNIFPNGLLSAPKNSTINYYKHGDIVAFSCNEGYKFQGNSTQSTLKMLECSTNSNWIGSITSCIAIKCPWPLIEHETQISKMETIDDDDDDDGAKPNQKLLIVCEEGYVVSNENVTCNINGRWLPATPKCLPRQCSSLSSHPIANLFVGKIIIDTDSITNKNSGEFNTLGHLTLAIEGDKFHDKFTLQCNDIAKKLSFRNDSLNIIINKLSWQCDENGDWKPIHNINITDNQLRRLLISGDVCSDNESSCPPPLIPSNGYLIDTEGSNRDNWKINHSLTYKCRSGYEIHGIGIIFCMGNGTWSQSKQCKPVNCGNPPTVINTKLISVTNDSNIYVFGHVIQYMCLTGHRLFGQDSIRCLANGKWSRLQGKCSQISCGKPNVTNGIILEGKSYLYQEELAYRCQYSNVQGKINCRADGTWSKLPTCKN